MLLSLFPSSQIYSMSDKCLYLQRQDDLASIAPTQTTTPSHAPLPDAPQSVSWLKKAGKLFHFSSNPSPQTMPPHTAQALLRHNSSSSKAGTVEKSDGRGRRLVRRNTNGSRRGTSARPVGQIDAGAFNRYADVNGANVQA